MLNKKPKNTSARKIAANRRNAQKSTGPRHPRKTRTSCEVRQENWVRSLSSNQEILGQDPAAFASFLADLIDDWQPAGTTEMMLVEDLTVLEWERRKIDRAQEGLLVQRITREEHKRARHAHQLEDGSTAAISRDEVAVLGLRNSPDCPAKFREMLKILGGLMESVKDRDFSNSADDIFKQLYGKNPHWRATQISSYFAAFVNGLVEVPEAPDPEDDPTQEDPDETPAPVLTRDDGDDPLPPAAEGEPVADDGESKEDNEEAESEISEAEDHFRELYSLLLEEYNSVAEDYQDFMRDHIGISRPLRDSLLAFTGRKSAQMIRHRNSVDRHIERKMKLLMALQKERRAREARAPRDSSPDALRRTGCDPARPPQSSLLLRSAATCAVCAIFFLLGMIFTQSQSPTSDGFLVSPQVRMSHDLSGGAAGISPLDAPTHNLTPRPTPFAPAHFVAKFHKNTLQQPNFRDVFVHIESHQVDENKENAFKTKANLDTEKLALVTLCKLSHSRLDIGEPRTENGAMIHRCTGASAMGAANS